MGDRCPTCHGPVTIIGTTDLGPTLRRVEKIEGKWDRVVTDNERHYREALKTISQMWLSGNEWSQAACALVMREIATQALDGGEDQVGGLTKRPPYAGGDEDG